MKIDSFFGQLAAFRALVRSVVRAGELAQSKLPLVFACGYYAIHMKQGDSLQSILTLGWIVWILCLNASFGYAINSYSDKKVDRLAGKKNTLSDLSSASALFVVSLFPALALVALFTPRPAEDVVILTTSISFLLAWSYSVPPIRLKERGAFGLIAAACAQRVLPAVIVFRAFGIWNEVSVCLCVLGFLIGVRYMVVHQILDLSSDRCSGVNTIATTRGGKFMQDLLVRWLIPAEAITLLVSMILAARTFPGVLVMFGVYLLYTAVQWFTSTKDREKRFSPKSYWFFSDFYNVVLPTFLSVTLVVIDGIEYLPVALFNIIWINKGLRKELKRFVETVFDSIAFIRRRFRRSNPHDCNQ